MNRYVLLIVPTLILFGTGQSAQPPILARQEFGFSLNPTAQGELYALFIYTVHEDLVMGSVPMRPEPYILQVSGLQESRANLEGLDLFYEFGIAHCGPWADDQGLHDGLDCSTIRDLWKLRYKRDVVGDNDPGWAAEEFTPSVRQQIILQAYRNPAYEHWHGPYYGKDAFRLLRDMQDPKWVALYRDGG
ncbi:MAG: hypothetical protein KDC00_09955 [Flavobacteriales bacterium]|nr:hypothetical protein [Flavobacteriales bacterium]